MNIFREMQSFVKAPYLRSRITAFNGISTTPGNFIEVRDGKEVTETTINDVSLYGRVNSEPQMQYLMMQRVVTFSLYTEIKPKQGSFGVKRMSHNIRVSQSHLQDTVRKYIKIGSRVLIKGKLTFGEVELGARRKAFKAIIEADNIDFIEGA